MALTKSTEDDKIEIVGECKHIQIRTATIIKEDGVELSRKFSRRVLRSGTLDASDNFVDTDISSESAEIQSICNGVWSTTAKDAWKAKMIASKAS